MLRLILDGEPGQIPFRTFLDAMEAMLDGVVDVDHALSQHQQPLLDWALKDLEDGSVVAALVEVPRNGVPQGYATKVRRRYLDQLRILQGGQGVPPDFSSRTVERLARVIRLFEAQKVTALRAVDLESGEAVTFTEDTQEAVRRILSPRYSALGSVIGTLDTLGRRGGTYATVYEDTHSRAVRCEFDEALLPAVKEALFRRVLARGVVAYNDESGAMRVKLNHLEVLPDAEELPTVTEMHGAVPDLTGGQDSVEYVRQLRDA